jgi:hypothetical protein
MTLMTSEVGAPEPGTPKWWLRRLETELIARTPDMQKYRELVDDEHDAPESAETSLKFARIAGMATTNLTGLAVEATAERMSIEGIRIGDEPDADKDVWDNNWQRSDFDAGSQDAITAALVYSRSMISVEPPSASSPFSRLHYEDPRQVVLAQNPDGSKAAALKVFTDEWTGDTFGTLYLPQVIVKMVRKGNPIAGSPRWIARPMPADQPVVVRNPLGEVPFFELQNKLTGSIRSEVAPLEIPQKRLNQLVFNTDAVAEYGAFRQKWVTGIEVPRDPVTGQPVAPYSASLTSLFVAEDNDVTFGDFNPTDPGGYIELGREIAAHISRLSRVPITYFLSNISNLGGDALALLISGLVLKCERRVKGYEPAIEGAVRLALRAQGDPRAEAANIEVKWADMETRSPAQSADSAVKLTQGDNPVITPQTAQEKYLGMSQTERDRDDAWRRRQQGGSAVLQALRNVPDVPAVAAE